MAFDSQLAAAEATLKGREDSFRLRQKRFNGGMTSELELKQAEAELASAQAAVPKLAQAVKQSEHALAVLLGIGVGGALLLFTSRLNREVTKRTADLAAPGAAVQWLGGGGRAEIPHGCQILAWPP